MEEEMDAGVERQIDRVFSDTSVSQTETHDRLQTIIDHCRDLQDTLDEAEQNQD